MDFVVLPDAAAVAHHAANMVQSEIDAVAGVLIGLAGGSTPRATYEELAKRDINWSHTAVWMTDERWVPPDDEASNQRMARASLVDDTGVAFLAPDTTLESVEESATDFTVKILSAVSSSTRSIVLLGIGTDGHTASLFPGSSALGHHGVSYVANHVPSLDTWRLTATFDLLATADIVIFLVTGTSKAAMVAAIAEGADVPSARVSSRDRVVWLLDEASASGLRTPG